MAGEELPQFENTIIAGRPNDDAANRAFYAEMGMGDMPWPAAYASGAEEAVCAVHGGKMWLGPESVKAREQVIAAGRTVLVVCILCAAGLAQLIRKHDGEGPEVVQLGNPEG